MKITNLHQAEVALKTYIPLVASYGKDGMTLDRLWVLLKRAGEPHTQLRVVHIAGTSGKTSTAYYAAAQLRATGKKVGLTVSPHVDFVNERVQINGLPLPPQKFCSYLTQFLEIVKKVPQKPSYFELMIAMALWIFVQEKVDYAVVETGMGGLLDGSNVVTRPDKVCVLTDIGFDHQHVLGNTLSQIAAQKAGIMHNGNVAFTYKQPNEVMNEFKNRAQAVGAKLTALTNHKFTKLPQDFAILPLFQQRNWLLAYTATDYVIKRDKLPELSNNALQATMHTIVPGRMQVIKLSDQLTIVMDGAHNQQKMQAFVASYKEKYGPSKVPVLLALKNGKEYQQVLDELLPLASTITFTTFSTSQDMPAVSIRPQLLADYCQSIGYTNYKIITNHMQAYKDFVTHNIGIAIITGSFYLLSQIRTSLSDK